MSKATRCIIYFREKLTDDERDQVARIVSDMDVSTLGLRFSDRGSNVERIIRKRDAEWQDALEDLIEHGPTQDNE
jgi:hypothetical protein